MDEQVRQSLVGVVLDGRYQILEAIGDGAAGAVFRARQLNVDRDVAVKVLALDDIPKEMLSEVVSRFENEARVISRLRHPHTIRLYDFGRTPDGRLFLVMELLRGTPLDRLLSRGPLDERRTLRILRQVSEALVEAHQEGIIHRDLKPQNIFLEQVGGQEECKILDFGIARAPSQTLRTQQGTVIGTPAFMSPEQAQGQPLDARSDLYSLGVVAYQCLSGRLPFSADTPVGVLVKHVTEPPPPLSSLEPPIKISEGLERLIMRLLAKSPAERPADAREVREAVRLLEHRSDETGLAPVSASALPEKTGREQNRGRGLVWVATGGVALFAALVFLLFALGILGRPTHTPATHFALAQLTDSQQWEIQPAFSPDGKFLAYVQVADKTEGGKSARLMLHRLGGDRPIELTSLSQGVSFSPAFSPDGGQIAFVSDREGKPALFIMGAMGESPRRLTEEGFHPAWSPDGKEIFYSTAGFEDPLDRAADSEIWAFAPATGAKRKIIGVDAIQPNVSPRGRRVAYWSSKGGQRDIWTVGADGEGALAVTQDAATDYNPLWSQDGKWLLFLSDRSGVMGLWRVPIDEESGRALGSPESISVGATPLRDLALAPDGRLAFAQVNSEWRATRLRLDPETGVLAKEEEALFRSSRPQGEADLSPDGKWLATSNFSGAEDVFIMAPDGASRRMLTHDPARDRRPRFSPDGKALAFYSNRSGQYQIWTVGTDGTGLASLGPDTERMIYPVWSPQGDALIAARLDCKQPLWLIRLSDPGKGVTALPFSGERPEGFLLPTDWSPDGQKVAGMLIAHGGPNRVFVLDLRRNAIRTLGLEAQSLYWLADSRRLLGVGEKKLLLIDSESGEHRSLRELDGDADGGMLAFSRKTGELVLFSFKGSADLWLMTPTET
ncbi:MAG: protein kinase [Myxococcales bacterium]|nr:protein kinase [Myxococcales bacterium]